MGFNTSLMLCNDYLREIEKDHAVGANIAAMIGDLSSPERHRQYRFGYRGIHVIATVHANYEQIVAIGHNRGRLIGTDVVVMPILNAARELSRTNDPSQRRRLIQTIARNGAILGSLRTDKEDAS